MKILIKDVRVEFILDEVAALTEVPVERIFTADRYHDWSGCRARGLAAYLIYTLTDFSLRQTSTVLGHADHTTTHYHVQAVLKRGLDGSKADLAMLVERLRLEFEARGWDKMRVFEDKPRVNGHLLLRALRA
jgi:chromosomal replication initiation ATPase DnaA